ncbi:WD repeat protein [Drechmeria coniospora]|uniref:WD repeat protein n=1 Tax=Drechmeria coniospora TaxID=98403 RepID=A0A151GL81_DRECN|nr:WD repeat protein [Drechmeria coniospora]KYK57860.1 WD repeat protein [Drechmeria coniospora]ODA83299.1 hypothetical protein RJ55_01812 [Drechmeria coniospora]
MPFFDQSHESHKKGKIIKSAYDSESFDSDGTIHVDGLVGSATISPSGRDIALASPEGLAIIDLDSPYNPPRRLRSHGLPWLVCDVQWSPFAARDYWVVSTANHRALVWNLNLREDSNSGAIEHSLQGHSRAITDVNFSAHHPDLLATCSVDGYVHWWDLRRPRQPALTFCDWFAGATQVKFNRQDPHILASAHDRWLHVWDERKACKPVRSIGAHTSKIYGIDWNRTRPTGIVTCSLDKTIKFWDYGKDDDDMLEHVIRTDFPVWRARHTPFGWGLLAMPQNEPGDLYLYDRLWTDESPVEVAPTPVAVFPGHGDHKAKEFLWRTRGGISGDGMDHREFQLVSWGTDNELRLHCVDSHLLSSVGHVKDGPARKGLSLTRQGAAYKTYRTVDDTSNRDRKAGTMSDGRSGTNTPHHKQSALTLGMASGGPFGRQARPAWRGPSMKAKVGSNKSVDRSQAQLGWMKGITMTKRKASTATDGSRRHVSKDVGIVGHYLDDEWGQPDTIQEELLRVSTQIPKVKWENIDMDSLTLKASLNGPWGAGGEPIFIKVKIDVPTEYPKHRAPNFVIEKTSFMSEETHKKITREVNQLGSQFLQRKQNCLEVAFTYLLGEVDLESSTTFFKNVRDLEDGLDGLDDESSSEEDEDMPGGGSTSMSQELVTHGDIDAILAPGHRNMMPPTPRSCGVRISNDGKVVCFFPSKEEKARALFSTSAEMYSKERARGEPFFAGFGRLAYDLPARQRYAMDEASVTDDLSDEPDSDASSSTSSDSESTSVHKMNFWYRSGRQLRKPWSEDRSVRSSGGGTGAGTGTGTVTGTGTGTSRRRFGRGPRNLISIHDLSAQLPSKREFAEEYIVFGDGADVCEHNARVAERHGHEDLVDVWRYLALLLSKGIPLEVLGGDRRQSSILVIARDVVLRCRRDDYVAKDQFGNDRSLLGRVKWGCHPLANEFIGHLFDHYEKMADVQMLAMLSCVFSEPSTNDGVAYVESRLPRQETPLPLKAPSFTLDYFPTDASAWGFYSRSHSNSAVTTPGALHTPIHGAGSQASDDLMWVGDPEPATSSYSCGETPPTTAKPVLRDREQSSPMSRSPTGRTGPGLLRGTSGLASALTANLPRSITGGSSSSPTSQGRKRSSPAEYILNGLAPSTENTTQGSGSGSAVGSGGREASMSDDECRKDDLLLPLIPLQVSVTMEDQTMFDDDGWLSAPFLDPDRARIYADYRHAYAEMLHMWGQPLARLEVLKFNVLREHAPSAMADENFGDSTTMRNGAGATVAHRKNASSPIMMGRKDQLLSLLASGRGLDVTGICRVHETQLEPTRYTTWEPHMGGAVGTCDRCRRSQTQLRCVYCLEPVDALYPACLSCGCASHEMCLAEWHAAGERFCPAGDECNCVEEAANGQVESWAALQGAMLKGVGQGLGQATASTLPPSAADGSDDGEGDRDKSEWERVEKKGPSRVQGSTLLAPATLSFGRLKKSAGSWSRTSSTKRTPSVRGA